MRQRKKRKHDRVGCRSPESVFSVWQRRAVDVFNSLDLLPRRRCVSAKLGGTPEIFFRRHVCVSPSFRVDLPSAASVLSSWSSPLLGGVSSLPSFRVLSSLLRCCFSGEALWSFHWFSMLAQGRVLALR
ncbi:hypothetical protein F2Q68_00002235 [Brassica cretica]|uniref:Uncharacterized protein n=1 Tax=Brassica cretica TaxID=69181 RepID=A0A8S9JBH4_BRACR|nr:hypothetical protein F2Q68_00002235 [Brassica cretica]